MNTTTHPKDIATTFFFNNFARITPGNRLHFIAQCVCMLQSEHQVKHERALHAAYQALGEVESKQCPYAIDIDHSTSFAVVVTNRVTKAKQVFTIAELIELLPREIEHALAPQRAALASPH